MIDVPQSCSGFLLIDKPSNMTSHDAVNIIRKKLNVRRVGHGGTLDPAATGLLIIAVGRDATKQLGRILTLPKTYKATIRLGAVSSTDDAEGEITIRQDHEQPTKKQVHHVLNQFHGTITQTPPAYSALKVRGVRAYTRARRGEDVVLQERNVTIHAITLLQYEYPDISIDTSVSSGTYIRSLARDIGEILKCGAYLSALRRTSIGPFHVENAVLPENVNDTLLLPNLDL